MLLQIATVVDNAARLLADTDAPFLVRLAAAETLHAFREVVGFPVGVMDVISRVRQEKDVERRDETVPPAMRSFYRGQWNDLLRQTWDHQTEDARQVMFAMEKAAAAARDGKEQPPVG